jgi:hypothetical protein
MAGGAVARLAGGSSSKQSRGTRRSRVIKALLASARREGELRLALSYVGIRTSGAHGR